MNRLVIPVLILFLAASKAPVAAEDAPLTKEQRQAASMKLMPYTFPHVIELQATGRTLGNGFVEFGDDPAFQQAAGTTDEQYYAFSDFMLQMREDMRSAFDPVLARALDTNEPDKLVGIAEDYAGVLFATADEAMQKLNETISPEQLNRLRELEFQMTSPMLDMGLPIINYDAYKTLNLSEKQQEELEKVRLSFEKEQKDFFREWQNLFPIPGKKPTQEDLQTLEKKLQAQADQGKKLTALIRAKIVTLLDKDQEKRLAGLKTNIPDFVKEYLKKRGQAPKPVDEKKYETWKDSWKPGDPIPPEFREREKARRRAFPAIR